MIPRLRSSYFPYLNLSSIMARGNNRPQPTLRRGSSRPFSTPMHLASPIPSAPAIIDVPDDATPFEMFRGRLNNIVLDTITKDLQFERMMPVQSATLPDLLQGKDCLAQAKTGTGKTLAFLIPAIENMIANPVRGIALLVICPTRELALQIAAEASKVLQRLPKYKIETAIGGTNKNTEVKRILSGSGCSILVATPGRLIDHLNEEEMRYRLSNLQTLVLDEADRMLDMGFLPDIKRVLTYLPNKQQVPRRSMLFSATVPDRVREIAGVILNPGYSSISTIPEGDSNTHERVKQHLISVPNFQSLAPATVSAVKNELQSSSDFKAIVFAPTAAHAEFYTHVLESVRGLPPVFQLHSRLSQSKRTKTSQDFRQASTSICVATDVIARGMDFPGVSHVFQVGLPMDKESYVHRLGRTARADADGKGVLILTEFEKVFVNQLRNIKIEEYPTALQYSMNDIKYSLTQLEEKDKKWAYQATIGYYKTYLKTLRWTVNDLVREVNKFALEGLDCPELPGLEKTLVGKMGLKGVPGLVVVPNAPRPNNQRQPGRQGGGQRGR